MPNSSAIVYEEAAMNCHEISVATKQQFDAFDTVVDKVASLLD